MNRTTLSSHLRSGFGLELSSIEAELFSLNDQPSAGFAEAIDVVRKMAVPTQSVRFMNQLTNGVSEDSLEIEKLISLLRTTASTTEASPSFTQAELAVIDFLGRLVGWSSFEGAGVPGASLANLYAVLMACERWANWAQAAGFSHSAIAQLRSRFVVFASDQSHYSIEKAVRIAGLRPDALKLVQSDAEGRMEMIALESAIERVQNTAHQIPLMIVATAGTTVLGGFDPIDSIASLLDQFEKSRSDQSRIPIWLHIDAAWGGAALFDSAAKAQFFNGVNRADSIVLDAHKFFGGSLPSSVYLHRPIGLLQKALASQHSDYLFHGDPKDQGLKSIQCGRRPDAFSFWYLIKKYGAKGLGDRLQRFLSLSHEFSEWLNQRCYEVPGRGIRLVHQPSYLNLCVNFFAEKDWDVQEQAFLTQKLREKMKSEGVAFINTCNVANNGQCLRFVLSHPELTIDTLKEIFDRAQDFTRELKAQQRPYLSDSTTTSIEALNSGP